MHSIVQERGHVSFPAFLGERVYMRAFRQEHGLPSHLKRWQPTIDEMLEGIDANGRDLYLMIDQSIVVPNTSQRRPGVHIDGYWIPAVSAHGTGGHISNNHGGRHSEGPGHMNQPFRQDPSINTPKKPGKGPLLLRNGKHDTGRHLTNGGLDGWAPEGLLLASDVVGCTAYEGQFDGTIGKGGDCSELKVPLRRHDLRQGRVHALNVTGLHESIPIVVGGPRTLVRINVPGWSPEQ
jgi:hypothetical protein